MLVVVLLCVSFCESFRSNFLEECSRVDAFVDVFGKECDSLVYQIRVVKVPGGLLHLSEIVGAEECQDIDLHLMR